MFRRNAVLSDSKEFQNLCDSSREVRDASLEDFDLSEDTDILFDKRTEDEKRRSRNLYMRTLYQKFMEPNSTVEILYQGGLEQFCKDVESGVYDD